MTNEETASVLLLVAGSYLDRGRKVPPHVVADLEGLVANDETAASVRADCAAVLARCTARRDP